MTNILEGVQYRSVTVPFADLTPSKGMDIFDIIKGGGWTDVEDGRVVFPTKTEFRYKPEKIFQLHEGTTYRTFTDRNLLNMAIKDRLDNEQTVQVSIGETASSKRSNPKLQTFDGKAWVSVVISGAPCHFSYATKFRIRPDYYHTVTTNDLLVTGTVTFHDIDELAKYVDNRIRTNGLDFSVKKVRYQ